MCINIQSYLCITKLMLVFFTSYLLLLYVFSMLVIFVLLSHFISSVFFNSTDRILHASLNYTHAQKYYISVSENDTHHSGSPYVNGVSTAPIYASVTPGNGTWVNN